MTAPSTPDRELQVLFALSSGKPGRDPDYERWYESRHLPDMKSVPGVKDGQFYRAATVAAADDRWRFCGRFQMARPNVEVMTAMIGRAGTPAMPLTDAIDTSKTLFIDATAQTSQPTAPGADTGDLILLGAEDAVGDEELGAWRRVPGVAAVHAFTLAGAIRDWISPWRTFVVCDIRTGQGPAALAALAKASERWRAPRGANYVGLFERIA